MTNCFLFIQSNTNLSVREVAHKAPATLCFFLHKFPAHKGRNSGDIIWFYCHDPKNSSSHLRIQLTFHFLTFTA